MSRNKLAKKKLYFTRSSKAVLQYDCRTLKSITQIILLEQQIKGHLDHSSRVLDST